MENDLNFYIREDPLQDTTIGFTPTDEFANLRTKGYSVEFKDTIDTAWKFSKPHLLQLITYTLLCFFAYLTLTFVIQQIVGFMGQLGYLVGVIVNLTLISAFLAGFYCYFKKIYSQDNYSFQTLFEGFKYIGQLALYQIMVVFMIAVPFLILFLLVQQFGVNKMVDIFDTNTYETSTIIFYVLFSIPSFLVFTLYIFAPILIVLAKMNFWSAMELSRKVVMANFIGILGFVLGFAFLNFFGLLFLCLGLVFTLPLTFTATFILYVKLVKQNGRLTDFGGDFYTDENAPLDAF